MRWRAASTLCVGALAFVVSQRAAGQAAAGPPRVAVFEIEDRGLGLSDEQREILSSYLADRFGQAAKARVIPLEQIRRHLRKKDLGACFERRCQVDVERALGADHSLVSRLAVVGRLCVLSTDLYKRGAMGALYTAGKRSGCSADALVATIDVLLAELLAKGPLGERGEQTAPAIDKPAVVVPSPPVQAPEADQPWRAVPVEGRTDAAAAPAKPTPTRTIDAWPGFMIPVDAFYAPAPMALFEIGEQKQKVKLLDQAGAQLSLEWRVGYMLLGGYVTALASEADLLFETGGRLGVLVPIDPSLALSATGFAGISLWTEQEMTRLPDSDPEDKNRHAGTQAGLALGIRYRFASHVGAHAEVAASTATYNSTLDFALLRLQLLLGVMFNF